MLATVSCKQTEKVVAPKLEIHQNPLNDLIRAIQWVESRNDTNARNGKSTATGVLQILEVTLKDFNRITKKGYVMDDRLDSLKSVEIFMTIQNHYNPTLNFKKAIHLWHWGNTHKNKTEEDSYYLAVMSKLNEIETNKFSRL